MILFWSESLCGENWNTNNTSDRTQDYLCDVISFTGAMPSKQASTAFVLSIIIKAAAGATCLQSYDAIV